jgi:hypothetical protein
MTAEKAMRYAREDIEELCRAPTQSDCETLHSAIISYCRALLDCGQISVAQQRMLTIEADAELARWQAPAELPVQGSGG